MKIFYILEQDEIKEVTVEEWRKWDRKYNSHWFIEIGYWHISTWFYGCKEDNLPVSLWVTVVSPKNCVSGHAVVYETKWNTAEEAQKGHKELIKAIKQGFLDECKRN